MPEGTEETEESGRDGSTDARKTFRDSPSTAYSLAQLGCGLIYFCDALGRHAVH
jgi:hypothetical protein